MPLEANNRFKNNGPKTKKSAKDESEKKVFN
jgi:hypothetical protein